MVATERWYPPGFMGSEEAILQIAKIRNPARWNADTIAPEENLVWHELGKELNATYIWNHLGVVYKGDASMIDRLYDFSDALVELRGALFSGKVIAYFLDENGKQDFILKDGWGGDEGGNILLRGVVDLVDGWRRLIMLKSIDIDILAESLPPVSAYIEKQNAKDQALKLPAIEKRKIFEKWRLSLGEQIPTLAADIAAMKARGINRDDARELRKAHPRLPRGKPRSDKIGGA